MKHPWVLAPARRTGQDAPVTESQDDLASRGRAIFQRLRGGGRTPRRRRNRQPRKHPPRPAPRPIRSPRRNGPAAADERAAAVLTDEELEAFSTPPPPDRPEPAGAGAAGPCPGCEDLPELATPTPATPTWRRRRSTSRSKRPTPSAILEAATPTPRSDGRGGGLPVRSAAPPGAWPSPTRRVASGRPPRR